MFNRKYKKGMADAARAYEAFGEKQEAAIQHVLEEIRSGQKTMDQGLKDLGGEIDGLYEYLSGQEKANLYGLNTPLDIKELGEEEKRFLVAALYQLAADKAPNEEQQNYLRAVQKYLDIRNPQLGGDILERVESIEDLQAQKAILQTVLEYLCLQGGDSYDETELQQDFLDSFSVNKRQYQEICDHVELLYRATGAVGLSEKYGFVPEDQDTDTDIDDATTDYEDDMFDDLANLTAGQIHELPFAKRVNIPIKSEEDLQMAKEDHPLDILTRPVETDTYGVVDSSLYKKYSVLVAAKINKDGKPLKIYDIRVLKKPDIRLEDLTADEIDAISKPWSHDGKFFHEKCYTLADARKSMLERFEEYYQDQLAINSNPDQWDTDSLWRKDGIPAFSDNKWRGRDSE